MTLFMPVCEEVKLVWEGPQDVWACVFHYRVTASSFRLSAFYWGAVTYCCRMEQSCHAHISKLIRENYSLTFCVLSQVKQLAYLLFDRNHDILLAILVLAVSSTHFPLISISSKYQLFPKMFCFSCELSLCVQSLWIHKPKLEIPTLSSLVSLV